jgi:CRP/FNR family transcriptional regulator, cyclic AMP receptor protein
MTEDGQHLAEVEAVLASIPMFRHLGARQRTRLAEHFCRRTYQAGEVVVRQGDTSMSFYVVLSGGVRIVRHSAGDDGVGIVEEGTGSFFGEMGVIDDLPRAATVVALEPTECALLAKWDFQRELAAEPGIGLALISVLNARIRALEDRLSLLSLATPAAARSGG